MYENTSTPAAGTRVRDTDRPSRVGTVVSDPKIIDYPGLIPVLWDTAWRTFTAPEILETVRAAAGGAL